MILINNSKNKIKRGSITYNRASGNGIYIENYIIEGEIKENECDITLVNCEFKNVNVTDNKGKLIIINNDKKYGRRGFGKLFNFIKM